MRLAITGASGFIGSRLCARLAAEDHRVRALFRRTPPALPDGIEPVAGDLDRPACLRDLVDGADAVMHLAGAVRGADEAAFDRANVAGTARLLAALDAAAPGAPLLFVSSLAAREPSLSWYAASKHRAEELVRAAWQARPALILRPPPVYGPGDRELLPVFGFMARWGLAPVAGDPDARMSLIFVDDVIDAASAWIARAGEVRASCALHDGRANGYGWRELADIVGAACGRRVRLWRVPRWPLDAAARANLAWSRLSGRAPMLTPAKLRELRHPDWVCDNAAITGLLDWRPRVPLAEGLQRTAGWRG